jgi:hypothetical protein
MIDVVVKCVTFTVLVSELRVVVFVVAGRGSHGNKELLYDVWNVVDSESRTPAGSITSALLSFTARAFAHTRVIFVMSRIRERGP